MEKELVEKKNDLITRAEEVLETAKTEKRELTDAEAQELAEIRDNVRRIMKTLQLKGEFDKMEGKALEKEGLPKNETRALEERAIEEEKAFADYIRGVVSERANNLTPAEGSGQVLIPTTIANRIIKKVYDICPILERSSKYNIKGTLEIPYYDVDTTTITVAWATEFQELDSNVGKFTKCSI